MQNPEPASAYAWWVPPAQQQDKNIMAGIFVNVSHPRVAKEADYPPIQPLLLYAAGQVQQQDGEGRRIGV
jgi:hypothetical protein